MLVLSRKINESILIGGNIEIVVLGSEGDTIKLGIKAPKHVDIYRKELYEAIQASNKEAARNQVPLKELAGLLRMERGEKSSGKS